MNFRFCHRTGFTLVETALALLAISLGLMGIFGLARHGLKAAGSTENEIRCTLLADTFFGTLKAKNDELASTKTSLENWWLYWVRFASGDPQVSIYLPPMPEVSESGDAIRIALGTHELDDFLPAATTVTEIKWNPVYSLTLAPSGLGGDLATINLTALSAAIERGQLDVTLTVHPGILQSGADRRTYSTVLTYTGGLP